MQNNHKSIFLNVANRFNYWIGLREPNYLADRWIGKTGYIPKSIHCKAKTSTNSGHNFGGLVVDPLLCPEAFDSSTLSNAIAKWQEFAFNGYLPANFSVEKSGSKKGLLLYQGQAIHADYDLFSLNLANAKGNITYTTLGEQNIIFKKVQPVLNMQFHTPLIQHGPEMAWQGVGAAESEQVLFFGPNNQFKQSSSHVSKNTDDWH